MGSVVNSVVLARYNESVDWIVDIPSDFEVFLYNKGEKLTSLPAIRRADHIIERPNIGRESETYLNHMLTAKTNNRDFTVYAQGDPLTHSPDFVELLKGWRDWDDVQALSWEWRADKNIPPRHLMAEAEVSLAGRLRVRPEIFSLTNWGPLEFVDNGCMNMGIVYRVLRGLPEGTNIAAHLLRACGLDHIADRADEHMAGVFSYGAIFAVRNNRVANVPKRSLELLKDFATAPVAANGYILERLWLHFFGADFLRAKAPRLPMMQQDEAHLKAG